MEGRWGRWELRELSARLQRPGCSADCRGEGGRAGPWLDAWVETAPPDRGLGMKRGFWTSSPVTTQQGTGEALAAAQRVVCQEELELQPDNQHTQWPLKHEIGLAGGDDSSIDRVTNRPQPGRDRLHSAWLPLQLTLPKLEVSALARQPSCSMAPVTLPYSDGRTSRQGLHLPSVEELRGHDGVALVMRDWDGRQGLSHQLVQHDASWQALGLASRRPGQHSRSEHGGEDPGRG